MMRNVRVDEMYQWIRLYISVYRLENISVDHLQIGCICLTGGGSLDVGTFLLNGVDSGPDACPEMEGSSQLIPFGCPMTPCGMATSEKNCMLLDYCVGVQKKMKSPIIYHRLW